MPWFLLAFRPDVAGDLARAEPTIAQRLFDKTKWLASNVDNLRHEAVADDLPGICKYAVGDWRIFYSVDRADQIVEIHHIAHVRRRH
jgi:mRNA interferase RelE/StbE